MSLLSDLLDHIPPAIAGADKPAMVNRATERPRLVLVERIERLAHLTTSPHTSAATATPEWRHARDQYLNHVMTCRGCYAPGGRHCLIGADLRATYDNKPMEARP